MMPYFNTLKHIYEHITFDSFSSWPGDTLSGSRVPAVSHRHWLLYNIRIARKQLVCRSTPILSDDMPRSVAPYAIVSAAQPFCQCRRSRVDVAWPRHQMITDDFGPADITNYGAWPILPLKYSGASIYRVWYFNEAAYYDQSFLGYFNSL